MHTATTSSVGHLLGAIVVGCPEYVERRCKEGIQLRISLTEHDEKQADDEDIVIELLNDERIFPGFLLAPLSVRTSIRIDLDG